MSQLLTLQETGETQALSCQDPTTTAHSLIENIKYRRSDLMGAVSRVKIKCTSTDRINSPFLCVQNGELKNVVASGVLHFEEEDTQ